jgi:hypothetical protein
MSGVNLPITSPLWIAQRIAEQLDSHATDHPKEEVKQIEKQPISPAAKIEKAAEKDFEGISQMHKLHSQLPSQDSVLSMTDTATGQGYMVSSTKEISITEQNNDDIAMDDRRHVQVQGNQIIISD